MKHGAANAQPDGIIHSVSCYRFDGVLHISTKQVGELVTGLPPLAEQSRIATCVDSLRRLCAHLRQRLSASQTTWPRS